MMPECGERGPYKRLRRDVAAPGVTRGRLDHMRISDRDIKIRGRLIRIALLDGDQYRFLDDPRPVLDGLRESGTRIDLFTFMQRLGDAVPKYEYPMEWDNFAAVPITTFDHWWTKQLGKKTRNKARQSEKSGVLLQEVPFSDTLVEGIRQIYDECPVRQGKRFSHYGEDFETVRRQTATFLDSSVFIGAFHDSRLVGFAKLTIDETRTQAGLMHILSMLEHRDKAVTNALIAQAVRSCADRGISYLVYSRFSDGNKQRDSLSDFKEHNGFQKMDVPRYYVPLTPVGRIAFRLGLHHQGLVDHLPEPVISKLRELRKAWYERKLRMPADASS
jgi:hypothetical protein